MKYALSSYFVGKLRLSSYLKNMNPSCDPFYDVTDTEPDQWTEFLLKKHVLIVPISFSIHILHDFVYNYGLGSLTSCDGVFSMLSKEASGSLI
jgi:hypothetical protein